MYRTRSEQEQRETEVVKLLRSLGFRFRDVQPHPSYDIFINPAREGLGVIVYDDNSWLVCPSHERGDTVAELQAHLLEAMK